MSGRRRIIALAPLVADDAMDWRQATAVAASLGRFGVLACGRDAAEPELAQAGAESVRLALRPDAGEMTPGQLAQDFAEVLAGEDGPLLLICPPGPAGEELAADLAARLQAVALGRCVGVELDGEAVVARRAAYGGRLQLTMRCAASRCVAVARAPAELIDRPPAAGLSQVEHFALTRSPGAAPAIRRCAPDQSKAPLEGARLVVSGGRGVSEDGFALLERIADRLGGALGASLPAVDAGLAPVSRQIGQSGKFVTPDIYLAVGISGTPQHLAGVGEATRIIAINKDPEAPIFGLAEIGLTADWRKALPLLLEELGERAN